MEMPIMTSFLDEEWESLSKMFSSEDADFMLQLHGHELLSSNECDGGSFVGTPPNFWHVNQSNIQNVAGFGESFLCYDDTLDYANFQNISQESSYSSGSDNSVVLPNLSHGFHLANDIHIFQVQNDSSQSMDFCVMDEQNDNTSVRVIHDSVVPDIICPREEKGNEKLANAESQLPASIANSGNALLLKRKFAKAQFQIEAEDNKFDGDSVENPKKKSRVSRNAQKNKRNPQPKPKKNQKSVQIIKDNDEETNAGQNGQSSCSYSSEDDSNASQESNGGEASDNKEPAALNLNGKTRASRGSATDPQSLYARRRRERINERLRILQNLIPNGTKVDISTMLEEAVHYVKFLQLQIKLLSSDDMWMYAPIVYNGLDIGMYGRIFPTL